MSNSDQLRFYSALQLPALFSLDSSGKFIALKVKQESENTALHAIYIEQQSQTTECPFAALVTVTEWDGKTDKEEFYIEAESATSLIDKLQRFDEINKFVFRHAPVSFSLDTLTMQPQALCCALFPELGHFDEQASEAVLADLKNASLALLRRLEIDAFSVG